MEDVNRRQIWRLFPDQESGSGYNELTQLMDALVACTSAIETAGQARSTASLKQMRRPHLDRQDLICVKARGPMRRYV